MNNEAYSSCDKMTQIEFLTMEVSSLQEVVRNLKKENESLKEDKGHWMDAYQTENTKMAAQEAAYLKVIRTLTGRD
jgi:FtsZ-binding cell division protein ZapB